MIDLFKVSMSKDANAKVGEVLQSGFVGQGPKVEEFEQLLRNHFNNPYCNTLNSCTSGLTLAVHVIKNSQEWQPNYEVLTTPLTCTATNTAILANGVKLRWVDIDPNTGNLDLDDLSRKVSPLTRAIMVVHWGGYAVDLDRIRQIQDKCEDLYGFRPAIIEDCAHAWGATYKNTLIGNHGNICVFSFQAIKHFTTADGGLYISPTPEMHNQIKLLRWYGLDRTSSADFRCEQNVKEFGFKYHMNDVNAAIGIANLPISAEVVRKHMDNGQFYNKMLANVPGVKLLENKPDRQSSYWIYTLKVDNRDGFIKKMKDRGISVSQVHDRNDKHQFAKEFRCSLPNLDKFNKEMICIPCGWWVSEEDRLYIVDCIRRGW
jgi:dTDP-4-amino-4,6-dideoxygalactose transaminase